MGSQGKRAKGKGKEQRAKGKTQRAKGTGQRARSKAQRARSKAQRAKTQDPRPKTKAPLMIPLVFCGHIQYKRPHQGGLKRFSVNSLRLSFVRESFVSQSFKERFVNWLESPDLLRPVFRLLRSVCPILVLGKRAVITRHSDVVEVLSRDTDFTISEINQAHFAAIDGPFFLGMDRSPEYEREAGTLREVVRPADLQRIREFVTQSASALVNTARPLGRIDVVNGLARVVPIRLVESYFGIPVPDDPTMMRWMRAIFYDLFGNLTGDSRVHDQAVQASEELRRHADSVIADRQSLRGTPNQPDDVLGRLLALQDGTHSWIDNNFVRRNLRG